MPTEPGTAGIFENPVTSNFANADNMTVTVTLSPDADFKTGDSILAYVNGELRGKAKPVYNPEIKMSSYFFNLSGDRAQPVVFVLQRNGETIAQSTTVISYQSNASIGTLSKPLELQFSKTAGIVTIYPNPFTNNTNISVSLKGSTQGGNHSVQVSVFDAAGRQVHQMPAKTFSGTGFNAVWDGHNLSGKTVDKGVYFIKVVIDAQPQVYKVVKQ